MSAYFIVRYHGAPIKFHHVAGRKVASVVERREASTFTNESQAWLDAASYGLDIQHVTVSTRDAVVEARAA